jgi:hypothetical protein
MAMFKKWTKWEHIMFVEDYRADIKTYELLRRVDQKSGLTQWKRVYVKDCVYSLTEKLTILFETYLKN